MPAEMNAMAAVVHEGSCHCGAIGFRYHALLDPVFWSVRACRCSFCRAHHARTTSDPQARIEFKAERPSLLNKYRFAQRNADFLVCRQCGVYIGALIHTPRGRFGIVNINALRSIPADITAPVAMEYGAESPEDRIARREQRWSPVMGADI